MTLVDNGLEILDVETCMGLVATQSVGRVGISINALPAILPVNYCTYDDSVVFLTAPGTKLTAALHHAVVAFEVDDFDALGRTGWSVLLIGRAVEIYDPEIFERLTRRREPWAQGNRSHLVQITPELVTGRRLVGPGEWEPHVGELNLCTFG